MIKSVLQAFVFSFISIKATQYVIGAFVFLPPVSMLLFVVSISLLYFFMRPILKIVSMPAAGPGFLIMSFILTALSIYILRLFIPGFYVSATTVSELLILGYVLPSKSLTTGWAIVFSALLIAVLMSFFYWLCISSKKK